MIFYVKYRNGYKSIYDACSEKRFVDEQFRQRLHDPVNSLRVSALELEERKTEHLFASVLFRHCDRNSECGDYEIYTKLYARLFA